MKILFVNNFKEPDYLNDCVFHGLNSLSSSVIVECSSNPWYMLSSCLTKNKLYGKGFTIFCTIKNDIFVETHENIIHKIKDKYYDKIIYGSARRDLSFINLVLGIYEKKNIIVIDGEDDTQFIRPLVLNTTYYKRELVVDSTDLHPISFAIPEEKIIKTCHDKEKLFGTVDPRDRSTYIFEDENSYYMDYAKSYYGITCKKAGWDCMRHYEILASYTIPCFLDLENCPEKTLVNFPKKTIAEVNKYSFDKKIHPSYKEINEQLHDYTINNLTTKKLGLTIL